MRRVPVSSSSGISGSLALAGTLIVACVAPGRADLALRGAPGTGSAWPPGTAVVSFEERNGLVLLPATLRSPSGQSVSGRLIFDTGAPGLAVRVSAWQVLRLDTLELDGSRITRTPRPLSALEIGSLSLTRVEITGSLPDTLLDTGVVGLFGPSLLGDRGFVLDYGRHELAILDRRLTLVGADTARAARGANAAGLMRLRRSRARFGELLPPGATAIPFRLFPGGRILVSAQAEDPGRRWSSRPLSLLVDTGASTCAMFRDAVDDRMSRAPAWPRLPGVRVRTVLGEAREDVMLLPRLELLEAVPPLGAPRVETGVAERRSLPDLQGELPDPVHGLIGFSFLRRFRILLDYANELLWLDPVGTPEAFTSGRASIGLRLEQRWGQLRVAAVAPGSPAADGGVAFGEALVSIDRVPAGGMEPDRAERLLEGQPGSVVELVLRGDAMERVLRLRRR